MAYFAEKGMTVTRELSAEMDDLCLVDVESTKPSAAFMANVIIAKRRGQRPPS